MVIFFLQKLDICYFMRFNISRYFGSYSLHHGNQNNRKPLGHELQVLFRTYFYLGLIQNGDGLTTFAVLNKLHDFIPPNTVEVFSDLLVPTTGSNSIKISQGGSQRYIHFKMPTIMQPREHTHDCTILDEILENNLSKKLW